MELLPQYQQDLSALNLLYVRSRTGTLVPLASIATLGSSVGPLTVNHAGQLPSVTISFDLRQGVSIGTAVTQVQRVARSEEHTSELQSPCNLVCRLLLEKKKQPSGNSIRESQLQHQARSD